MISLANPTPAVHTSSFMDTSTTVIARVAQDLSLSAQRVSAVAELLDSGATIPFIARYRKEQTGEMDEQVLRAVQEAIGRHRELIDRRESMIASLRERELYSDELAGKLNGAESLVELEDLYLPFRPKRVTRASQARDRGLEPLAELLLHDPAIDPTAAARGFVDPDREVPNQEEALAGARDIIAEKISEDRDTRAGLRRIFERAALVQSARSRKEKANPRAETYRDYFDWSEPASRSPSHRILAMLRGEREGFLVVHVLPAEDAALDLLRRRWVSGAAGRAGQLELAAVDAYRRLLAPSLEGERKKDLFLAASEAAAGVFSANLRDLLLAAPLGPRPIIALDPGFRTGCKLVCLDRHGALVHNEAIYPLEPQKQTAAAAERIKLLVERFSVEAIAVGNGTGGREAVRFLHEIDDNLPPVISVNESGASVYSASDVAREEFPDKDVTVRGAVSIGRRLMDPLAELVKIDARSIGVGQYQHDIDSKLLDRRLAQTVESGVNLVGADLNTASPHLLRHISGVSDRIAAAIVKHRETEGGFRSRAQLLKVAGVGARTFEQAAGFLRVHGGGEPLDATAVHPERYEVVRGIASDAGIEVQALIGNAEALDSIDLERYATPELGMPTLRDIVAELKRPGRDPRPAFASASFSENVHEIGDLTTGMRLPGVVTNVTDFGAFVDIGVHRDGLVHISKLSDSFVSSPREVVRVGQAVQVTVLEVDAERKRISLSMVD